VGPAASQCGPGTEEAGGSRRCLVVRTQRSNCAHRKADSPHGKAWKIAQPDQGHRARPRLFVRRCGHSWIQGRKALVPEKADSPHEKAPGGAPRQGSGCSTSSLSVRRCGYFLGESAGSSRRKRADSPHGKAPKSAQPERNECSTRRSRWLSTMPGCTYTESQLSGQKG
jgi:hypothetical protein